VLEEIEAGGVTFLVAGLVAIGVTRPVGGE
jgi:hypothetical protein